MGDWARVKLVFEELVELAPDERSRELVRLCNGDEALRAEVAALLDSHGRATGFLRAPELGFDPMKTAGEAVVGADGGLQPGARLGPYVLCEPLGEGGFGTVYRAEQHTPVQRTVALKLIKPGMDTREVIARFEAERQALALMDHPNIARALDAGATPGGRPFFVMELVQGVSITRYCDSEALDLRRRLELMIAVCLAVQHAHQKGIIHRDIKPSNVLVATQDGRPLPKVIDFGVAKAVDRRLTELTLHTHAQQLVGTPTYMSPEQARLSAEDIDTRTDIYSLGVLLYELLTGVLPFEVAAAPTVPAAELQRMIQEVDPPRPSTRLSQLERRQTGVGAGPPATEIARRRGGSVRSLRVRLRGDLDWIVMKCLEKERSRRYESASELARDLQRHLLDEPVSAGPPSPGYRLRKFARRRRGAFVGGAVILLGLVVGLGVALWGLVSANRSRDRAVTEAAKAQAVSQFLQEMLASADPRQRGEDVSVREVLHDAARRLEAGTLHNQPEVEAAVRANIGAAFRELGFYDEARPHLQAALDLQRSLHGPEALEVGDALREMATLHEFRGDFLRAEAEFRRAYEICRAHGASDSRVAGALNDLSTALHSQGRYGEAEQLQRAALEIARRSGPAAAGVLPEVLNNLGLTLVSLERLAEAEPLYREALALNRQRYSPPHPTVATNLDNLATLLTRTSSVAEAETLFREALAMRRELFGSNHRDVAYTLHNLSVLLFAEGRREEARELLTESYATLKGIFGLAASDTLLVMNSLVSVVGSFGDGETAEGLMLEAHEALRASGANFARRAALERRLAALYLAMNRPQDAERWTALAEKSEAAERPATSRAAE